MRATRLALLLLCAGVCLAAGLPPANVKFKLRGYFMTAPRFSKPLKRPAPPRQLSLIARPSQAAAFGKSKGFVVVLTNTTRSTAGFEAQDFRINIVREALDADHRWKPIEYLPNSWSGNSYHRVYLRPNRYWSFSAPEYSGSFRTRMRFVLEQEGLRLISNEFEGSINREQFIRLEGHTPGNIMDPYDD